MTKADDRDMDQQGRDLPRGFPIDRLKVRLEPH